MKNALHCRAFFVLARISSSYPLFNVFCRANIWGFNYPKGNFSHSFHNVRSPLLFILQGNGMMP